MKENVLTVLKSKKAENNQLQQVTQALEQAQQAQQQAQKDLQAATTKLSGYSDAELQLKKQELQQKDQLENRKMDIDNEYNTSKLGFEKTRIQLEGAQLLDNNKNNDEIKNN